VSGTPDIRDAGATPPRLTIAIPTFNRAPFLRRLLDSLEPQVRAHPAEVALLVIDNASTDATVAVVGEFAARGVTIDFRRNSANLGIDANILACFREAQTEYVWIFGDDDVLLPGALAEMLAALRGGQYALVHCGGYSFSGEYRPRIRFFQYLGPSRVTGSEDLIGTVHYLLTFITRNVVNRRAAIEATPGAPFDRYLGSVINQLGFIFSALRSGLPSLILSRPLIAAQLANSGGYGACEVFGRGMMAIIHAEFPGRPAMARLFENAILENYFPYQLALLRVSGAFLPEDAAALLARTFGSNPRYWAFCHPIAVLPAPLARAYSVAVRSLLKAKRMAGATLRYAALWLRLRAGGAGMRLPP
jgi:abequosyltransferase